MCQGFLERLLWQLHVRWLGDFKLSVRCVHLEEKVHAGLWELEGFWEQGDIGKWNRLHSLILS